MSDLRSLVEQHYQSIANDDEEGNRRIFSPDVVTSMPGMPEMRGIEPFLQYGRAFHQAFPDGRFEIKSSLESGNRIALEGVYSGTHTGPLSGPSGEIPPTSRTLVLPFADFFEVENGRIVRHHVYFDQMALLSQLGLVPEPTGA